MQFARPFTGAEHGAILTVLSLGAAHRVAQPAAAALDPGRRALIQPADVAAMRAAAAAARKRKATVPSAASRSPTTSMIGTFASWASRILAPIFSFRKSGSARSPTAASSAVTRSA